MAELEKQRATETIYRDESAGVSVVVERWVAPSEPIPSPAERRAAKRVAALSELESAVRESTSLVAKLPDASLTLTAHESATGPNHHPANSSQRSVLQLRPAPQRTSLAPNLASLFTLFAGLIEDHHASAISLELIANHRQIWYQIVAPIELSPIVAQQLAATYPAATIELIDGGPPAPNHHPLTGLTLSFSPDDASLRIDPATPGDSLTGLLETLGALNEGETVRIQLVLSPVEPRRSLFGHAAHFVADAIREHLAGKSTQESSANEPKAAIGRVTVRILATAPTRERTTQLARATTAPFYQWVHPTSGRLARHEARNQRQFQTAFNRRRPDYRASFLVTADELASLYHLPADPAMFPKLTALPSIQLAPPVFRPDAAGLTLGQSVYRTDHQAVVITPADRLRHLYLIGQTGTGKSSLFQSLFLQDVHRGDGTCFIDPHGEAVEWLLERIPKHRLADVVLFDPAQTDTILGINLLEWRTPTERDLIIQELILLFYKLFDPDHTGIIGPQFEHWLRSAALTVTEPSIRGTLADIPRLFTDERYQHWAVKRTRHPAARRFWLEQMAQTSAFHRSEMLNYFTSKFGAFLGNATIAAIVGQQRSAFDLRSLMDKRKILLVNLSKGKIGELNAQLLGTILLTKLQLAALGRANVPAEQRLPYYVYLDEFHTIATDSFASSLAEIRKYGVALHLTHQYANQLSPALKDAVLGNVGTVLAFRLGPDDAQALGTFFQPLVADDLTHVAGFHAHCKTLHHGAMSAPFTLKAFRATPNATPNAAAAIRARMRAASAALQLAALQPRLPAATDRGTMQTRPTQSVGGTA